MELQMMVVVLLAVSFLCCGATVSSDDSSKVGSRTPLLKEISLFTGDEFGLDR